MLYKPEIVRQIIMEHYLKPTHLQVNQPQDKIIKHGESCADYLEYSYSLQDNKIINLTFNAKGCAFFIASTDLLIDKINLTSIDTALSIINSYEKLINNESISEDEKEKLGELLIFENVARHHNRLFCASMLSSSIKEILNE
nr:iron-sulfur cluster assembly scaffold protein [Mycoplasmopsis opalescens]